MSDTHIKIKPVVPKVQYTGNGVTTVFPYEFAIFDDSDMVVYFNDTIQESGYTISGAGQTDGGNVTFSTAPADGVKITLIRNIAIERLTDFQEGGTFRPKNLNDEFDRQTAFVQQVAEELSRSVKVGPTSDVNPETVLTQVERIYSSIDNVDAVADDISNVNAVAGNQTNIDAVAENKTNIDAVAGELPDIKTKANKSLDNLDATGQAVIDGKVDLDAANLSTAGKSLISGLGMPSGTYEGLTLGASGATYTAPANGWFVVEKAPTASEQYLYVGKSDVSFGTIQYAINNYSNLEIIFPAKKGQVVVIAYTLGGSTQNFNFFYSEGDL